MDEVRLVGRSTAGAPPLLEARQRIALDRSDGTRVEVSVSEVAQRNWSRTAFAAYEGHPLFLKQFVGLDGSALPELMHDEMHGLDIARRCFGDCVVVPSLVGASETQVVLGYEPSRVVPVDVALRHDPQAVEAAWPDVVEALAHVVALLADPGVVEECSHLPWKIRPYASGGLAVNFKGLELRNVGLRDWAASPGPCECLTVFDLGRPYLAPVEELVARLVVSTLLLNWGRPLSRFRLGPPADLADGVARRLRAHLSSEAIRLELEREARARRVVSGFGSPSRRALKRLGMATVGRWYLGRARRWCRAQFA